MPLLGRSGGLVVIKGGRECGTGGFGAGRGGCGGEGGGLGVGLSLMVYFSLQNRRYKRLRQKTSGLLKY